MVKNTTASSSLVEVCVCTPPRQGALLQLTNRLKNAFLALICQYRKRATQVMEQVLCSLLFQESDPVISERRDRSGTLYYRVYNPRDGKTYYFTSENEVRIWLERRYHA